MSCNPILIVDDDEDIRMNLTLALESEGYEVYQAENGKVAMKLLLSLPEGRLPSCIILDLMMPEMDGKQFVETMLKDHPALMAKMKIVIATAKGSPLDPKSIPISLERIQKPMDLEELYSVVRRHCGAP